MSDEKRPGPANALRAAMEAAGGAPVDPAELLRGGGGQRRDLTDLTVHSEPVDMSLLEPHDPNAEVVEELRLLREEVAALRELLAKRFAD